ncbi:MAG TPA: hypothetical protein VF609_08960 [Flavisolibacter sp.]|jgi:hypothetical protein
MMERKWMLAILVAALSVIVLQFFIRPVYVSDDDVLYLLTLSGGLGHSPSNLVHVSYGWHPLYGWLVKTFFIYYPHLNWYTVFLLLFHTFGLSAICYFLLSRFKFATGLLVYFLLFIVFEVRLLQHLDFTGSAMICAIGGCLVLSLARKRNRYLYSGACLVLAALLLRFHIAALVVILFAPLFIFPLLVKNIRMMVLCLCSIGVCWLLLHKSQIEYYNRAVPNWKERSAFRDDFFIW